MEHELGACLRSWRERLQPEAIGLGAAGGARRRARGLRREEVAQLAGLSVDYLARLEQGRAANPSPSVLAPLARALRLSSTERDHLYRVAGQAPPGAGEIDRHITPGVQRVLDRLADVPVLVLDASWQIVALSPLATALLGELEISATARASNIAWRQFTGMETRVRYEAGGRETFEHGVVADLRATLGRHPDDSRLAALIDDLRAASARFAQLWELGEVERHQGGEKWVDHPEVGPIEIACDVLSVRDSELQLVVYTAAPESDSARALALLGAVGLQRFEG
ncbi:helix-turn-helix transcriptional regulator [Conexibacter sp. JD483]|uniref:helix-turn-helix transcriptional regulator n=1 Tax=unclassified Conexibacter TaxID=2627773 RepID=UPI00272293CB|nr:MULTISPECIES: helix-turn-helix transcriptional regulator [unclassified Conexibacter]MDO8186062.1 helix-turn-helix transcriptional regulator [Conexibacter sp. CPCC 205706]MDO8199552.1 helix-turn-helix transcriptional regulator [Conexibacter sp. CPCC 205762]MDR9372012.1 helix-turn-helix transcriptional regulator [Conexibacter sp. JD483]